MEFCETTPMGRAVGRKVTAFSSQFPEAGPSDVPKLLDTEMVNVFEDAAA
jgi:hypothetical protein